MPKVVLNDTQEAQFLPARGPGARKRGPDMSRTPSLGEAVYASMISIVSTISISSTGANAR